MPRLIVTRPALASLERCRLFLEDHDPATAAKAAQRIADRFQRLAAAPETGRPVLGRADLRECVIPFGRSGYIALYRYEPREDAVFILAFRHQREAGY